jgi:hypothetical protein
VSGAQCSARLPRTVPQTRRELNHVTDAANRRSPRTGSVALGAVSPGLERTLSPGNSSRRAPGRTLRLFAERAADFIEIPADMRGRSLGLLPSLDQHRSVSANAVAGPGSGDRASAFHPGLAPVLTDKRPCTVLAAEFGVHPTTLTMIRRGKRWRGILDAVRREPGSDTANNSAESLGFAASIVGVRHPSRMESVDVKVRSEE